MANAKFVIIMTVSFLLLGLLIAGCMLIPFSFRVSGRIHRTQGFCQTQDSQVVRISGSGRGGPGYRAVWQVTVYAENSTSNPLFSNAAGFIGSLSAVQPYHSSKGKASDDLPKYVPGIMYPCIYPKNPEGYPYGYGVFDANAVFLGTYTQNDMDSSYTKARAMLISGIVLLVVAAFIGLCWIGYAIYKSKKFAIEMWMLDRDIKNLGK